MKKLVPGERNTDFAASFNPLVDDYNLRHGVGMVPGNRPTPSVSGDFLKVRNDTGAALPLGSVVKIGDRITVAGARDWWVAGETPDATTERNRKYAVLCEGLGVDEIGWAQYSGLGPALVDFPTSSRQNARIVSGSTMLEACVGAGDVEIINIDGTPPGELLCLVNLRHIPRLNIGKTTVAHDKGATQDVRLYYPNDYGAEVDSGVDVQVKNLFADVPTGAWVAYSGAQGVFYMIAAECEP